LGDFNGSPLRASAISLSAKAGREGCTLAAYSRSCDRIGQSNDARSPKTTFKINKKYSADSIECGGVLVNVEYVEYIKTKKNEKKSAPR